MGHHWTLLGLCVIGYLLGSVPFGLIVGKAKGIDPRTAGSGNIGATNVGRLLGGRYFALVFLLDLLKGMLPVLGASIALWSEQKTWQTYLLWLLVAFTPIFGHMCSVFLSFKGGKGVATSAGVALGFFPYFTLPAVIGLTVWFILFRATRYVSVASMIAAFIFPLAYVMLGLARGWDVFGQQLPLLIFSSMVCLMILLRHRTNLARLRAGTENRFTGSAPQR